MFHLVNIPSIHHTFNTQTYKYLILSLFHSDVLTNPFIYIVCHNGNIRHQKEFNNSFLALTKTETLLTRNSSASICFFFFGSILFIHFYSPFIHLHCTLNLVKIPQSSLFSLIFVTTET